MLQASRLEGVFTVQLNRAVAHRDTSDGSSYVFLLPDTAGEARLRRLHDALYDGPLRQWLDLRIPYLAHVTIAAGLEAVEAGEMANNLSQRPLEIAAPVDALTLVSIDAGRLSTVAVLPLERIAS